MNRNKQYQSTIWICTNFNFTNDNRLYRCYNIVSLLLSVLSLYICMYISKYVYVQTSTELAVSASLLKCSARIFWHHAHAKVSAEHFKLNIFTVFTAAKTTFTAWLLLQIWKKYDILFWRKLLRWFLPCHAEIYFVERAGNTDVFTAKIAYLILRMSRITKGKPKHISLFLYIIFCEYYFVVRFHICIGYSYFQEFLQKHVIRIECCFACDRLWKKICSSHTTLKDEKAEIVHSLIKPILFKGKQTLFNVWPPYASWTFILNIKDES